MMKYIWFATMMSFSFGVICAGWLDALSIGRWHTGIDETQAKVVAFLETEHAQRAIWSATLEGMRSQLGQMVEESHAITRKLQAIQSALTPEQAVWMRIYERLQALETSP